jgi:hypothetical protein
VVDKESITVATPRKRRTVESIFWSSILSILGQLLFCCGLHHESIAARCDYDYSIAIHESLSVCCNSRQELALHDHKAFRVELAINATVLTHHGNRRARGLLMARYGGDDQKHRG